MIRTRVALVLAITACAPAHNASRSPAPVSSKRELTEQEQIAHVLSRLTFGPRPGDPARVKAMGVDRWIVEQLKPESVRDSVLERALENMFVWTQPTSELSMSTVTPVTPPPRPPVTDTVARKLGDTLRRVITNFVVTSRITMTGTNQLNNGKILHAQIGERQLEEVLVDFWANHFSIYGAKTGGQEALIAWERDVIRANAMGSFRDLLRATAHSPAMLFYLDNHLSRKNALNENYARELMELHTLGVDGGYTQEDVQEVAKAFTGWTLANPRPLAQGVPQPTRAREFSFNPAVHDQTEKHVLGRTLAEGRGIEDAEEVLDMLASHPSTAHYISLKLARRFVSDDPPAALVDRAAATFMKTDGDIREVVRTIVTSPEFFSRAAFRAKTKTPFELVVSARRALEAPVDTTAQPNGLVTRLGQATYGRLTPDGWPDRGEAWLNSGSVMNRILFGADVANGRAPGLSVAQWRGWTELGSKITPDQADGLLRLMFGGYVDDATRRALVSADYAAPASDGRARLVEMLAMALGSPEFQRR